MIQTTIAYRELDIDKTYGVFNDGSRVHMHYVFLLRRWHEQTAVWHSDLIHTSELCFSSSKRTELL